MGVGELFSTGDDRCGERWAHQFGERLPVEAEKRNLDASFGACLYEI